MAKAVMTILVTARNYSLHFVKTTRSMVNHFCKKLEDNDYIENNNVLVITNYRGYFCVLGWYFRVT